jgi:hypothetical protein
VEPGGDTLQGRDAPWQWGTCAGGVRIPAAGFLSVIRDAEGAHPHTARSMIEHYLLLQLLVTAGSGMGGLV